MKAVIPVDTTADADQLQRAIFASMTGSQRVELAAEMAEQAKGVTVAGIRARNPDLDVHGVHLEWLRLLHGDELVAVIQRRATAKWTTRILTTGLNSSK